MDKTHSVSFLCVIDFNLNRDFSEPKNSFFLLNSCGIPDRRYCKKISGLFRIRHEHIRE